MTLKRCYSDSARGSKESRGRTTGRGLHHRYEQRTARVMSLLPINPINGRPSLCRILTAFSLFFDTKPYDREALQQASANYGIKWHSLDFRHTEGTAAAAKNVCAVGVFVNDQLDRPCLEKLASEGAEPVALRCAGFNNVDVQ